MAYSMAHLAAGSLCLLEPSGYARAGSGVTTSVSALGIGSWVSIRTTYPERRGHGRPPPLPPPRPPFAYCQSTFFKVARGTYRFLFLIYYFLICVFPLFEF